MTKKTAILLLATTLLFSSALLADTLTLKDGQQFEAEVINCDNYYMTVALKTGGIISIPWQEIRRVEHASAQCLQTEKSMINGQDADVKTLIGPLSRETALGRAIFPGFIVHGSGFFYAKDQNMGMSLLSAEIVSLVMMGIGVNEYFSPVNKSSTDYKMIQIVGGVGAGFFLGSWLYDIIFSPFAVDNFNRENKDKFAINQRSGARQAVEELGSTTQAKSEDEGKTVKPAKPAETATPGGGKK